MKRRGLLFLIFVCLPYCCLWSTDKLVNEVIEKLGKSYQITDPILFRSKISSLDSLDFKNHNNFNYRLLLAEKNRLQAMEARIKFGSIPRFNFVLGYNNYQSFERYASIYSHIPVAWDNDNPQQIDINLPNGGHGLIWVPQPTQFDWQYVPVHASYDNEISSSFGNAGFNYSFLNGVSINFLNIKASYKISPEDYGFPWSAVVSNNIDIPVLQLLGLYYSDQEAELKSIESELDTKNIQIDSERKYFGLKEKIDLLKICSQWYELNKIQRQVILSEKQYENLQQLSELQKVNAYELFNLDQEIQALKDRKDLLMYQVIINSNQFSPKESNLLILPDSIMIDSIIENLENKLTDKLNSKKLDDFAVNSSQLKIIDNQIRQAELNLKQSSKNSVIEVNLQFGVDMFQSDNLGYKSVWESLQESVSNPDGYNLNGNLLLSIPLNFFSPRIRYTSNKKDLESKKILKNQLIYEQNRLLEEMKFNVIQRSHEVDSQANNCEISKLKLRNFADLLDISRISETDYLYYEKGLLSSEIALFNAQTDYVISLLNFLNALEVD